VIAKGDTAVVDVHQINERNLTGLWRLAVSASIAGHEPLFEAEYPVELSGGETFGQLLKQDIQFPVNEPGLVTIHAALSRMAGGTPLLQRDEPMLVIDPQPAALKGTIACGGDSDESIAAIKRQFNADAVGLSSKLGKVATILVVTDGGGPENWSIGNSDADISNTADPGLFKQQMWGQPGPIGTWRLGRSRSGFIWRILTRTRQGGAFSTLRSTAKRLPGNWTFSPGQVARIGRWSKPSSSMR
jgi:hypothetical protein